MFLKHNRRTAALVTVICLTFADLLLGRPAGRLSGLAATLVAPAGVQPGDLAVVFSNSGVNAFPVEAAHELKQRGAYVVAVSSRLHMTQAPARSFAKLGDLADTVLDTAIPPGDAVVPTSSGATASISTICSAYLWDLLLARLARLSDTQQVSLPLWRSSNLPDGDAVNQRHFDDYRAAIPML